MVSGIERRGHRLRAAARLDDLTDADALVVVAGMEGALASVLGGDPAPVLPQLLAMLGERDPHARTGAAFALSRFGEAAAPAVDALIAAMGTQTAEARISLDEA